MLKKDIAKNEKGYETITKAQNNLISTKLSLTKRIKTTKESIERNSKKNAETE